MDEQINNKKDSTSPTSPVKPKTISVINFLDFFTALRKVKDGEKITKKEWNNEKLYFCFMKDGFLTIHNETGDHTWIIRDVDMVGDDYYVIS